jgi:hypothetical protein
LRAIDALSAEEMISQIKVSSYPHMKKEAQTKEIQVLKDRAKAGREQKLANFADVAKSLAQGMRRNG